MFEMRNEPPPNQYMRHQAWLIQRYYLKRCRAVRDTLEHEPVFALSSALGLMGIAPPETAVLDLGKEQYRSFGIVTRDAVIPPMSHVTRGHCWTTVS